MSISDATKQAVRKRAEYLCEYCHSSERLSANRFTVDHVIPRPLEGYNDIKNLDLACRRCNERRYNFAQELIQKQRKLLGHQHQQQSKYSYSRIAGGQQYFLF